MTNNDIFRRLRYILNYNENKIIKIFQLAETEISTNAVENWLKAEDDEEFLEMKDIDIATFLNGIITEKRGKKEGENPVPEKLLTNNLILRKLKIAFNLQSEDILKIMQLGERTISKHELSAFFRKKDHQSYRPFLDQYLRNFLTGLRKWKL